MLEVKIKVIEINNSMDNLKSKLVNWNTFKVITQNMKQMDKEMGNMNGYTRVMDDRIGSSKRCIIRALNGANIKNAKNYV